MIGRIVRTADFERVLGAPMRARSVHFALHFLAARPSVPHKRVQKPFIKELSTDPAPEKGVTVDDFYISPTGHWLGTVVPKRHARRAVSRTLIKRQMREVMGQRADRLPPGLWVIRLRAPFALQRFSSAASDPLRETVRNELEQLMVSAVGRAT